MTTIFTSAALLLVGACDNGEVLSTPTDGPLKWMGVPGGVSVDRPPRADRWQVTFGAVPVCATKPIVITEVSYDSVVPPIEVASYVHKLVRKPEAGAAASVASQRGSPESRSAAWRQVAGSFELVSDGEGVALKPNCGQKFPMVDILTTMVVDRHGGQLGTVSIQYQSGDRSYTLEVENTYTACGASIGDQETCNG